MSLALRRIIASPKNQDSLKRTQYDLANLWKLHEKSPCSSPELKTSETSSFFDNFLGDKLLTSEPRKRLYCPPVLSTIQSPKPRKHQKSFLLSRISITSDKPINLPATIKDSVTYTYKGCENQKIAWENFKGTIHKAKYSLISCAQMIFFFKDGEILTKGITSSAQSKIQSLVSSPDVLIDLSNVLKLIDTYVEKERLELYCTSPFFYSTMTPIEHSFSEMNCSSGKKYRLVFAGFIFSPFFEEVGSPQDSKDFSLIY